MRFAAEQSIFRNVWTEVRKQKRCKKADFVFNKEKTSCCLSPACATLYKTIDEDEVDAQVQKNTALKFAKMVQIDAAGLNTLEIEYTGRLIS